MSTQHSDETAEQPTDYKLHRAVVYVSALLFVVNMAQLFIAGSSSWLIVALNLLGLLYVARQEGLSLEQIGLGKRFINQGFRWGLAAVGIIVGVLLVIYLVDPNVYKDTRYHNELPRALLVSLVYVPLHTIIVEELAFRGVFWGALNRWKSARWATSVSSVLFGLWHIIPSLNVGESSATLIGGIVSNDTLARLLPVFAIVVVTSLAGVGLCELRRRSKSLLAPVMAHWAINGVAVLFSYLAWTHV